MLIAWIFFSATAMRMTTLYRFQKSMNKGNTQVNGSLFKFTYFCPHSFPRSSLCVLLLRFLLQHNSIFLKNTNFKLTVNVASWFGKEQNNLVGQSKLMDTIVRHSIEISEHDVMTYLTPFAHRQRLWTSHCAELVTLAPGLRPERRFAPLARGIWFKISIVYVCYF